VSPLKRNRRQQEDGRAGQERTEKFEIRPGNEWDVVVGKEREAAGRAALTPPPTVTHQTAGWLSVPAAAPAAEAILSSLMKRVQKLEEAVARIEARFEERS
jgi:hypothetical protein